MNRRRFIKNSLVAGAGLISSTSSRASSPGAFSPQSELNFPLRLDSNENPLGISLKVQETIQARLSQANRYPFSFTEELIEAIALHHGIDRVCVVPGAGSSEVLQMVVQALCDTTSLFMSSTPTFEVAENAARSLNVQTARIPLTEDYHHDLERLRQRSEQHPGRVLIYLCNPNNPTATLTPTRLIEQWIKAAPENITFLVDEAYHEYVDDPEYYSLARLAETLGNLIVTRSFSKIYALAGLRVGYGIAAPGVIDRVKAFASAGSVNTLGVLAAVTALQDSEFVQRGKKVNEESKQLFIRFLRELNLDFLPTHTNFLMFRIRGPFGDFVSRLREARIQIGRAFPSMGEHCRISLGLPHEMEYVGRVLLDFREKGWI
ncbi:MAG TPA: histidinol-phosphate transaminase [Acidobacteriota bacterium]|nr:histidinol-phosphate transaminase [Acidobacteriota bacterium]